MPRSKTVEPCNHPDCSRPAKERGLCGAHLRAGYVLGCSVDGCDYDLFSRGLCMAHYMRRRRKKEGGNPPPQAKPIRSYGGRTKIFTRIDDEVAARLQKGGRTLYTAASEILTAWAEEHA